MLTAPFIFNVRVFGHVFGTVVELLRVRAVSIFWALFPFGFHLQDYVNGIRSVASNSVSNVSIDLREFIVIPITVLRINNTSLPSSEHRQHTSNSCRLSSLRDI